MNRHLLETIKEYAIKGRDDVIAKLRGEPQERIASMLVDLLTRYYNDLNSSTLREAAVVLLSGYDLMEQKIGYDGSKLDPDTNEIRYCEVKPRNIRSVTDSRKVKKLNGDGNFTDYSWKKLERHSEENPEMLVAGFVDGQLVYIFSFDFSEPYFIDRLRQQLQKKFPNGVQPQGLFLRSAAFSFKHFQNASSLRIVYCPTREKIAEHYQNGHITMPVCQYLLSRGGGLHLD